MPLDLDTFLTVVYTMVDTLYQAQIAPHKPMRPGRKPDLHDSEVVTLMLVAQWHPSRSERYVGGYAATHWRGSFAQILLANSKREPCSDAARALALQSEKCVSLPAPVHLAKPPRAEC